MRLLGTRELTIMTEKAPTLFGGGVTAMDMCKKRASMTPIQRRVCVEEEKEMEDRKRSRVMSPSSKSTRMGEAFIRMSRI